MVTKLLHNWQIARTRPRDAGVALPAAMGVMIIALSLGALIVATAITSTNDSARNRARTVEVHAAEGLVDIALARLSQGDFICELTSERNAVDGVGARAAVTYWDKSRNEINCDPATRVATAEPAYAQIKSTATETSTPGHGLAPVRTFEAAVVLGKDPKPAVGAALFSVNSFHPSNSTQVRGTGADVWVDAGDYECRNNSTVTGRVFTPSGSTLLSGSCQTYGPVDAGKDVTLQESAQVGGDVRAWRGNVRLESPQTRVAGDVRTGGRLLDRSGQITGTVRENDVLGTNTNYQSSGLPPVEYSPSDWEGHQVWSRQKFMQNTLPQFPAGGPNCDWWEPGLVINLPDVPTVVDLDCALQLWDTKVVVNADTAIFVNNLIANGRVNFVSGDGTEHKLWLITPKSRLNKCQPFGGFAGMHFTGLTTVSKSSPIFLYTPCSVTFTVSTDFAGQVYGQNVDASMFTTFDYVPMGVPGVDLLPGYFDIDGIWDVDVIHKRETNAHLPD